MTLAGFGRNDEITNEFRRGRRRRNGAGDATDYLRFFSTARPTLTSGTRAFDVRYQAKRASGSKDPVAVPSNDRMLDDDYGPDKDQDAFRHSDSQATLDGFRLWSVL